MPNYWASINTCSQITNLLKNWDFTCIHNKKHRFNGDFNAQDGRDYFNKLSLCP